MGLLREMCKSICIKHQAIHGFAFVGFFWMASEERRPRQINSSDTRYY
jgi:hypothetical protein